MSHALDNERWIKVLYCILDSRFGGLLNLNNAVLDDRTSDVSQAHVWAFTGTPQTPTNSVFTVKASDGTVLAYIDNTGNLRLKGELFESI